MNKYGGYGQLNPAFEEVFNDFRGYCDKKLIKANYVPLNKKNLFDLLLACSIYSGLDVL